MIRYWAWTTFRLMAKIFFIIMALLTLLELLKAFGWIHTFVRALVPFLRIMGLDQKVGFLWMTAVIFGPSYGGTINHPGGGQKRPPEPGGSGAPPPFHRDEPLDGRTRSSCRWASIPSGSTPLGSSWGHHRPASAPLSALRPTPLPNRLNSKTPRGEKGLPGPP
jgi:hypothetical protein